jgi:hypothetical protein
MGTRVDLEMKRGVNELGVQGSKVALVEGIYAGSATKMTREEAGIGTRIFEMRNQSANDLAVQVRFEIPTQGRQET